MPDPALRLVGLERRYGAQLAVAGIDLDVAQGEFVTLLGPSGCGKTTTLNMIAGFVAPTAGSILIGGQHVEDLPPFRRDLGVVFQDYALFPHMTVAENVAFGLTTRRIGKAEIATRVRDALDLVHLAALNDRRPQQLSGGQRQRVAIARALVIRPRMLLLDEPLSNLDLKLREEMRSEISVLQRRLGIATVFVTHDQGEALAMSDRIAVMRAGRIEQCAAPSDIYLRPSTHFVARFIGSATLLPGTVQGIEGATGLVAIRTAAGTIFASAEQTPSPGTAATLVVRPERLRLSATAPPEEPGVAVIAGSIESATYVGARSQLVVRLAGGQAIEAEIMDPPGIGLARPGVAVFVSLPGHDCRLLPASG
jgi:spermidine/putrescine ABC transporter ATP-binding subunit